MTLKQLEAFYWAATCGSFAIAAQRLHIAQSSLSKRINELESFLDKELFDRDRWRAVLSPAGAELLPRARALLEQADELISSMGSDLTVRGKCRLGVGEIAASSWLPRLVTRLNENYPDLRLEPYVELGQELEARLLRGELDAAMIARKSISPQLQSVELAEVAYVWVVRSDIKVDQRTAEELARVMPIATMSNRAGSTSILDTWRERSNAHITNLIESNSMTTMLGLAAAGVAMGYFPRGWIEPLLQRGVLQLVDSVFPLPKLTYRFHWRADDNRVLIQKIRELTLEVADYSTSLLML